MILNLFIIRQPNTYAQGFGRGAFAWKPMAARELEEAVMHAGAKHEEQVENVVWLSLVKYLKSY